MKKLFALLLAVLLVVSLAACGESEETPATTTAATEATTEAPTEPAEPVGTLYITFGATIEIAYDAAGNALQITGTNETGKTIATACADQVGQGCVFAARKILRYASDNKLLGDAKSMAVRVGFGDPLPTEDFLETIVTDCQYLADEECTGVQMANLSGNKLDEQGNLTPATAKTLAARFLGVEEAELADPEAPTNGKYVFSHGDTVCSVDTFYGLVTHEGVTV